MPYTPHTDSERARMLARIGVGSVDELFSDIPASLRLASPPAIPEGLSEQETLVHLQKLAAANHTDYLCFLGAGAYDHLIPTAIHHLIDRQEFLTAYTPYQPEVSQGTLTAIFTYQTAMSRLYGLDCANASLYDGASAAAEAVELALRHNERTRVLISAGVHPDYVATTRTYLLGRDHIVLETIPLDTSGKTDAGALAKMMGSDVSVVLLANPNFFGVIEADARQICTQTHDGGALAVISAHPLSLGILEPPGALGADIGIGEGQPLGIPLGYGGPYLGIMTAKQDLIRRMPGRIIGKTKDVDGKTGYVMVLQTREQHIRREKATSNICSNEGLLATTAAIYCSLVGKDGIIEIAEQNLAKSRYAAELAAQIPGYSLAYGGAFWNEFVLKTPLPAQQALKACVEKNIYCGVPLSWYYPERTHELLVAVTEKRTRAEIDRWVKALGEVR
jgi:glycine dehydrogenase subunit 1